MDYSCPISFKQIDSNVSRLISFLVSSLVILYLYTQDVYILYFVALDFVLRLFVRKESAPLYITILFLKEFINIKEKFVDSGAKRLAALFGLAFVVFLIISHFVGMWIVTLSIAGVFLACSLMDVFLNYCIGCKIYYIIKKIYPSFMK